MKVKVTMAFYDGTIHRKGEIMEVKKLIPDRMELIETKEVKAEAPKKATKSTKKG